MNLYSVHIGGVVSPKDHRYYLANKVSNLAHEMEEEFERILTRKVFITSIVCCEQKIQIIGKLECPLKLYKVKIAGINRREFFIVASDYSKAFNYAIIKYDDESVISSIELFCENLIVIKD